MQKAPLISLMVTCLVAGCINGIEKPLQQAPKPTQTSSAGDQTSEVPLPLEQTAECMLKVLKTVPGVSEPRLGNVTTGGMDSSISGVPRCRGVTVDTTNQV
jgi:hypothetical protein